MSTQQTFESCPDCGEKREVMPAIPGVVHRTRVCDACLPQGFARVGVELPASVVAIIKAAGGETHMPRAMAAIVGALPWISVALFKALPEEEYRGYARQLRDNVEVALVISNAADPVAAFNDYVEKARKAVN